MEKFKSLSRYDIEQVLTPEQVRITQIISLAIFAGTVLFFIPIFVMNSAKPEPLSPMETSDMLQNIIYAVVIFAVLVYTIIYFFQSIFMTPNAIRNKFESAGFVKDSTEAALHLVTMDRQFRIIQLALLEGVSLFALVGIFLELAQSEYQLSGDIWLLTLPVFIFAIYLFFNFPTKENILNRIEKDILVHIN